jgi:hypothetical protein
MFIFFDWRTSSASDFPFFAAGLKTMIFVPKGFALSPNSSNRAISF